MAAVNISDPIESITPEKESWHINGRIVYAWEQVYPGKGEANNLDFILMDSEGKKIQATIHKRLIWKYKSLVVEGEVRYITNFRVSENSGDYRVTKHPYKIVFTAKTTFSKSNDTIIPERCIEFASFKDIIDDTLDTKYLIDVIGHLNRNGELETTNGKKKLQIELIDNESNKLICTLWETLAIEMANKITKFKEGPANHHIIIIRCAKLKTFRDSKLSNTICSRIEVDAEFSEVRDFIRRSAENGCMSSSLTLTHLPSQAESIAEELLDLSARRTIDEIREIQEEGYFVCLATITGFDTTYKWYIERCKSCRETVELDDMGKWMCTGKCEGYAKFVVPRYKVRVKVIDHTGNATFVLFDTQATKLIQQSAKDLRDNQLKHGDPDDYPSELNVLIDRKFIFKIKVDQKYNLSMGWESYGVSKISENPELIEKYISTCEQLPGADLEVDSRVESVVDNEKGKESVQSTGDQSTGDLTSSFEITPTKRSLESCEDDVQLSTSKRHVAVKVEGHGK